MLYIRYIKEGNNQTFDTVESNAMNCINRIAKARPFYTSSYLHMVLIALLGNQLGNESCRQVVSSNLIQQLHVQRILRRCYTWQTLPSPGKLTSAINSPVGSNLPR